LSRLTSILQEENKTLKTLIANNATFELGKARLCSAVILALIDCNSANIQKSTTALQKELGKGWSLTSAMQFMSGKRAKNALEQDTSEEQVYMLIAHQAAREVCSKYGLGAVESLNEADMAEFRALIEAKKYQM
jgi:hypothetical protein